MGLIRDPEGLEFLVESTKPTAKSDRELSAAIAKNRLDPKQKAAELEALAILSRHQQRQSLDGSIANKSLTQEATAATSNAGSTTCDEQAAETRQRLEAEILQLPLSERAYLLHRLVDSLTPPVVVESTPKVAPKPRTASLTVSKTKRPRAAKSKVSS